MDTTDGSPGVHRRDRVQATHEVVVYRHTTTFSSGVRLHHYFK